MDLAATVASHGQGLRQAGELLLAFTLSSLIGLERQFRGRSAGLRTQAIVGTTSALIILISKYGFGDVIAAGEVVLDPSRVAAQVVSGIGFLGAGLIITRRGAIRGLTTAASVWETAAIGMAAGAGLPLLALLVTFLHFVVVFGYAQLGHLISDFGNAERTFTITYDDGAGVLRAVLDVCSAHHWSVASMAVLHHPADVQPTATPRGRSETPPSTPLVAVRLNINGRRTDLAFTEFASIPGVVRVDVGEDEGE